MRAYLLRNGRIVIGNALQPNFGDYRYFKAAWLVEHWGTTKGLSELQNGPLPETTYFGIDKVSVRDCNVILSIEVKGWANPLDTVELSTDSAKPVA